jgi:Ser-tRNA(Ala) deacylase AlaX
MTATQALFGEDAYLRGCAATVVESLPHGVVLDRTVF